MLAQRLTFYGVFLAGWNEQDNETHTLMVRRVSAGHADGPLKVMTIWRNPNGLVDFAGVYSRSQPVRTFDLDTGPATLAPMTWPKLDAL